MTPNFTPMDNAKGLHTGIELTDDYNDWAVLMDGEYVGFYKSAFEATTELVKAISVKAEAQAREEALVLKDAEARLDTLRTRNLLLSAQAQERHESQRRLESQRAENRRLDGN